MTRVKSLVRLKMLTDELRLRASTTRNIGIEELLEPRAAGRDRAAEGPADRRAAVVLGAHRARCCAAAPTSMSMADPQAGFFQAAEAPYECVLVSTALTNFDRCGSARRCARSTARASCRSSLLADDGEDERICAASNSASTTI